MRPFAPYPDSFDGNTLGYWRFGERGGSLAGVLGPTFTAYGTPALLGDGIRLVAGQGQYLDAALADQPARNTLTFECWVRGWALAAGSLGVIAEYFLDANNHMLLHGIRQADPSTSTIQARAWLNSAWEVSALWQGSAADAVLGGAVPWHVAASIGGAYPNARLFVNGLQVAVSNSPQVSNQPAGNWTLRLGRYVTGWSGYDLSAVLDEVRLSSIQRYAAAFPVTRHGEGRRALVRGPGETAGLFAGVAA